MTTSTQAKLLDIYSKVLAREVVDAHADLFELGGNSQHALMLISRVRKDFGVRITIRNLYESRTAAALARLLDASLLDRRNAQAIEETEKKSITPLSYPQQRLWFLDQLHPHLLYYYITPTSKRIKGPFDTVAWTMSVNTFIARHSILRTTFPSIDGTPYQSVLPELELSVPLVDLSMRPMAEREEALDALLIEDRSKRFDLAIGPLIRAQIVRMDESDHVVTLTLHHILTDGWSTDILGKELAELYASNLEHRAHTLPPLPIQYSDFSVWQNNYVKSDEADSLAAYWKRQLAGAPRVIDLPVDRQRSPVQTCARAFLEFNVGKALTGRLNAVSSERGATLFMTLLAALKILFYRYSGHPDVPVGGLVPNRNRVEVEPLVGFFVNTLVFRSPLNPEQSFNDFLDVVRATALDAYAHQDLPFEKLLDALEVPRSLSHSTLFQILFVFQQKNKVPQSVDESAVASEAGADSPEDDDSAFSKPAPGTGREVGTFDIAINITEENGILRGQWECNDDIFDRSTIKRFHSHFLHVLKQISMNPEIRLMDISLLSAEKIEQTLSYWKDARPDPQLLEDRKEKVYAQAGNYLLDEFLHPVPPGVIGDLYVDANAATTAGCIDHAASMACSIKNPFDDGASRIIFTNTLAKYSENGKIEYLGPKENFPRINGIRVDLQRIERCLLTHPAVERAAIMVQNDDRLKDRLIGFVSARADLDTLRSYLKGKLPDYMIPVDILPFDRLSEARPGTAADLIPASSNNEAVVGVPPPGSTEALLLAIWRDILAVDEISVNDDFFLIGGSSMLAVKLQVKIRDALHVPLPLPVIFTHPTIRDLAAQIGENETSAPARLH